jgi:outer membrane murein-binding lipoprotein Lpp
MKRFLMLVGVGVVAAAMYVAAGTASQQSRGPTLKQFKALKAQVATLSKKLKATKAEADAIGGAISTCFTNVVGVSQFGDPNGTFGYQYIDDGATVPASTSALDADGSTTPQVYMQTVDASCVQALRHRTAHAGSRQLPLHGERLR